MATMMSLAMPGPSLGEIADQRLRYAPPLFLDGRIACVRPPDGLLDDGLGLGDLAPVGFDLAPVQRDLAPQRIEPFEIGPPARPWPPEPYGGGFPVNARSSACSRSAISPTESSNCCCRVAIAGSICMNSR
jgi:hypothetical protein